MLLLDPQKRVETHSCCESPIGWSEFLLQKLDEIAPFAQSISKIWSHDYPDLIDIMNKRPKTYKLVSEDSVCEWDDLF